MTGLLLKLVLLLSLALVLIPGRCDGRSSRWREARQAEQVSTSTPGNSTTPACGNDGDTCGTHRDCCTPPEKGHYLNCDPDSNVCKSLVLAYVGDEE